ncbi:hypothetical protein AXF42_Ash007210 [Apostasia shenzhenica]|uniref:Uncharacterized protein n=1 Tax=Apostasia shenzhenica TaxID=1088818 RepID=A0A2I0B9I1_9ASPA|nr:hypothetical protein AXF42_Ash007210 [Apostasia shenzhenica]
MSMERIFDPWEEMQRHGQDFADRLAQGLSGFSGLLQSPMNPTSFNWPSPSLKASNPFDADAILDIGGRLGRAGSEFGACLNGVVQQFFRRIPAPFWQEGGAAAGDELGSGPVDDEGVVVRHGGDGFTLVAKQLGECRVQESSAAGGLQQWVDEEGFDLREFLVLFHSPPFSFPSGIVHNVLESKVGTLNISSTYDSSTNNINSTLVARGDLWRAEASHGSSTSGNENSPLFLIQLGPVLFVRDTTLLLPVHLSKQHLLWYGYDRKFPNGQLTYIAGEGLTHSAFLPAFGGLLQAQGQYPGETRFSFSCKNRFGTRITPLVQLPDKSFSLGLAQTLSWKTSGLMVHPTIQLSICPTFGGSNPGLSAEFIHSLKEKLSLICGFSSASQSSAFASLAIGRSKWNGNRGSSGVVVRVEAPLNGVGRPAFSIQLNNGLEF